MVVFPATALWLVDASFGGFEFVFAIAAVTAFVGVALSYLGLRPKIETPKRPTAHAVGSSDKAGLIDRGVLVATTLNLGSSLVMPAVIGFLPLYARELGISNIGYFYLVAGVTSVIIRPLLGKQSDRIGRGPAIALAFLSLASGLLIIAAANSLLMLLIGGVFTTLGGAINGSTTTALAMDLANPESRGRAMATFSLSFQVGAGGGGLLAGVLADLVGFRIMYLVAMLIVGVACLLLGVNWRKLSQVSA